MAVFDSASIWDWRDDDCPIRVLVKMDAPRKNIAQFFKRDTQEWRQVPWSEFIDWVARSLKDKGYDIERQEE